MAQRNKSPSRFDDNKRTLETISSLNKDLHSTKKNLFIQEFQLDDIHKSGHDRHVNNRIITLTTENMDPAIPAEALPAPVTPEQKLRRYLSLKLSADFRDLLTMSASPSQTALTCQSEQTLASKYQVFSLFTAADRLASTGRRQSGCKSSRQATAIGSRKLAHRDFICLPDFGENTRVAQLRDADSILDSLFS